MRYPVTLILLLIVSGCASRQPVSFDPEIAKVMPADKALEILHERQRPDEVVLYPAWNHCLFKAENVESVKSGNILKYDQLALAASSEWMDVGKWVWRIEVIQADDGGLFCRYGLTGGSKDQARVQAQEIILRIATAWVAMGGKIAEEK